MQYRKESYFEYLILHLKDLKNIYSKAFPVIMGTLAIVCFSIFFEGGFQNLISGFKMLALFVIGIGIFFFLFPMTLYFPNYKSSARHFNIIKSQIVNSRKLCSIQSNITKIMASKNLYSFQYQVTGDRDINHFDFNLADVFETKSSLFLFPIRAANEKDPIGSATAYLPTIRIARKREYIPGLWDINEVVAVKEVVEENDLILKIKERKGPEIILILKNYSFNIGEDHVK